MDHQQLNILFHLASLDGNLDESELNFIKELANESGIQLNSMEFTFSEETERQYLHNITPDDKFELVYYLIRLMKIDGKLHRNEVNYCAKICSLLGYNQLALLQLMLKIHTGEMSIPEKEALKYDIQKYLND